MNSMMRAPKTQEKEASKAMFLQNEALIPSDGRPLLPNQVQATGSALRNSVRPKPDPAVLLMRHLFVWIANGKRKKIRSKVVEYMDSLSIFGVLLNQPQTRNQFRSIFSHW
jgi:hypothetical protein